VRRWYSVALGIFLIVGFLILGKNGISHANPLNAPLNQSASISITNPEVLQVTIGEGDDFATQILGDPWDMDRRRDTAFEIALDPVGASGGEWAATFTGWDQVNESPSDGYFFPLFQGFSGALNWITSGANDHQAIDSSRYTYLSYRLDLSERQSYAVYWSHLPTWPDGTNYFASTDGCYYNDGSWHTYRWLDWHTYIFDMTADNGENDNEAGSWQGGPLVRGLRIDSNFLGPSGTQIGLDWVRLTDPTSSEVIDIQWSAPGANGSDEVDIYIASDASGSDASPVIRDLPASAGSYNFYTSILPPGDYYFSLVLREDLGCGPYGQRAATLWVGPLTIKPAPELSIQAPSMTSGPDYATEEVGDPWDMNNSEDIWFPDWTDPDIENVTFSDGVMSGYAVKNSGPSVPHSNAQFLFNLDDQTPIDPNVYRYFTIRYGVDAPAGKTINWLMSEGWGARVVWGKAAYDQGLSKYGPYYEGWGTYSVDLADPNVPEPEVSSPNWTALGTLNYLRFDPMESTPESIAAGANHFYVDWAMLTAMDSVSQGSTYYIEYTLQASSAVDLTFFYDADRNPGNGRVHFGTDTVNAGGAAAMPVANGGSFTIYLPLIMKHAQACGEGCYAWNTSGVTSGEYYVCILAEDDFGNQTYRCSDAPLRID
jgi:hypothetical protein